MHPVAIANERLRVEIAVEHGAEVRFLGAPGGPNVLAAYDWHTPAPARWGGSYGTPLKDWLSEYSGGWQELFPNAGDACVVDGVGLPYHGELSRVPWEIVERGPASVALRAAARLPLVVEREMRVLPGAAVLEVRETVVNPTCADTWFSWGHHPAFEALPGMEIDLPEGMVCSDATMVGRFVDVEPGAVGTWPLLPGVAGGTCDLATVPDGVVQRICYLPDRPEGWVALRHPVSGRGVAMAWDLAAFPHLWLWQDTGTPDFPWYGRARIVALEPQAAWPGDGLAAAIERGQAHRLAAGERLSTWLTVALFSATAAPVVGVGRGGDVVEGLVGTSGAHAAI